MRRIPALLLGLLTLGLCQAGTVDSNPDAAASANVDALFAKFTHGVQPGAGVLVVEHGKIVHKAVYGYADLEKHIPLSVDSTFRLDSVSKQFTAMAVMILKEEGRLTYDDPISKYLPELSVYPGVTVRHLLTHTGGLPDYYDEIVKTNSWPSNADARVFLGKMAKPEFAPGTRYEYSNAGYDMLGEVVAAASGMRFKAFVEQRVFAPIGMTHSLIHDTTRPAVPRRVLGYDKDGKGFKLDDEHPLNGIIGAGGVFTTLDDMYQWDQALYGEKLVKRATLDEAFTPNVLNDGKKTDYGFGWRISEYHHTRRISHGGSWVGFRSHIARHPDIGLTIVILSNRGDMEPDGYVDKITDIYMRRKKS